MSAQFNDPALLAREDRRGHGVGGLLCFFLVKVIEQKEEDSLYIL